MKKIHIHHFFFLHTGSPFSILTGFFKTTGGDGEGLEGGGGEGEDGGWGGSGKCERGCRGEGGVSSVAPSNWLKEVQVLALLLMTVTKRLLGIGFGGRGRGDRSGAVAEGRVPAANTNYKCKYPTKVLTAHVCVHHQYTLFNLHLIEFQHILL